MLPRAEEARAAAVSALAGGEQGGLAPRSLLCLLFPMSLAGTQFLQLKPMDAFLNLPPARHLTQPDPQHRSLSPTTPVLQV